MRTGNDLIGKHIISITDGKLLGDVNDLYLDRTMENLTAIFVKSEGLFRRKTFFIKRDSIYVFGLDVILVKNSDVVLDSSQYAPAADWVRLNKLKGRAIDTTGGTKVGKVGDVIVDEEAQVIGVTLSRVSVEGTVAKNRSVSRAAVVDMGEDDGVVTIDLNHAEQMELAPALHISIEDSFDPVPPNEDVDSLLNPLDEGNPHTEEE